MSETTHLICAHCGGDNSVTNAAPLTPTDGLLPVLYTIEGLPEGTSLFFHCQYCDADYRLPVYVRERLGGKK